MQFLRRRIPFVIAIIVVLIAFFIYRPFSPAGQQERNMKLAREHIAAHIAPKLAAEARFADVRAVPGTAELGCIVIDGTVRSARDMEDLKYIVEKSRPPVEVSWPVTIAGKN